MRHAFLLLVLTSNSVWADTILGTKADLATPKSESLSGAGVGAPQIFQMILAVAIVIGILKFGLPKVVPMLNKRLSTNIGSSIRIEESAAFAGGNLYVVSARDKTLLLSVNQQGVQCLADLSIERKSEPEEPAFFELLDKAKSSSPPKQVCTSAVIETGDKPTPSKAEIEERLKRLKQLAG